MCYRLVARSARAVTWGAPSRLHQRAPNRVRTGDRLAHPAQAQDRRSRGRLRGSDGRRPHRRPSPPARGGHARRVRGPSSSSACGYTLPSLPEGAVVAVASALDAAVDDVRDRFGSGAVTWAVLLGRDQGLSVPLLPDRGGRSATESTQIRCHERKPLATPPRPRHSDSSTYALTSRFGARASQASTITSSRSATVIRSSRTRIAA